mmetsp:Transcript_30938/g.67774  ORF Transcript_30938/g.67774 Transcript_30938/m.67774 type:complete len:227 (+) Transcript_30938:337-1017(+)
MCMSPSESGVRPSRVLTQLALRAVSPVLVEPLAERRALEERLLGDAARVWALALDLEGAGRAEVARARRGEDARVERSREAEQVVELQREGDLLQEALAGARDHGSEPGVFELERPEALDGCRVIVEEEDGRREARHALHGGGADDAVLLVPAQRERHGRGVGDAPQLLPQHERVLDGHAAALAQIGHHRVRRVAEQTDAAARPLQPRRAVVQIALLDLVERRRVD